MYSSRGQAQRLAWVYRSQRAFPEVRIPFDLTLPQFSATPQRVSYQARLGGQLQAQEVYIDTETWGDETIRATAALSTADLATGVYPYTLTVTHHFGASRVSAEITGDVVVINDAKRPYGAGWGLSGFSRLVIQPETVLWVSGDGSSRVYRLENGRYRAPEGDFSQLTYDGIYRRTLPNGLEYQYDDNSQLRARVDRNGQRTRYVYDGQGRLKRIKDPTDRAFILRYQNGFLDEIEDPAQRITQFEYVAENLNSVIFPDGREKTFGYDHRHLMIQETNARGDITYRAYDEHGQLVQTLLPDQDRRRFTSSQSVGLPRGPRGRAAQPLALTPSTAAVSTFTDRAGQQRTVRTNRFGSVTELEHPTGLTVTIDRNALNQPETLVYAPGTEQEWRVEQDFDPSRGLLLSRTERYTQDAVTVSRTTEYGYHETFNLLTHLTDARGWVEGADPQDYTTQWLRDARGNLIELINPLGQRTIITPDAYGRIERIETANGLIVDYDYDDSVAGYGMLRTLTETPPVGGGEVRITTFRYDAAGQPEVITTADNVVWHLDYDAVGRLERITDQLGQSVVYVYDADGHLIEVEVRNEHGQRVTHRSQAYDALGRLLSLALPQGHDFAYLDYEYDHAGRLTDAINGRGWGTAYEYEHHRLARIIDANEGETRLDYDALNRIAAVTAPNGAHTTFVTDPLGRVTQEASPDRGQREYQYDVVDNLTQLSDGRGEVSDATYDALQRLTGIDYADDALDVTLRYDEIDGEVDACPYGTGRLCRVVDDSGQYDYDYDAYGNLIRVHYAPSASGATFTTEYTYDAGHQVTTMTLPSGRVIEYTRDALRRLASVETTVQGQVQVVIEELDYRADGVVLAQRFGNGLGLQRGYDAQGRLDTESLSNGFASVSQGSYLYDENSQLRERQGAVDGEAYTDEYRYDRLDRLDTQLGAEALSYEYDANGNRLLTRTPEGELAVFLHSGSNRVFAVQTTEPVRPRHFEYNAAGRLSEVREEGLVVATYRYNQAGLRTHKTVGSVTTLYHYDLAGRLISETEPDGTVIREYIYALGVPVAQIDGGAPERIRYVHTDHLGTPWLATDDQAGIIWRWQGRAFGDHVPDVYPDGGGLLTEINLRFPGQYADAETGFYYNWNRYYDPATGRYLSSDPIGLAGGLNTYGYAGQNPTTFIDPTGETPWGAIFAGTNLAWQLYQSGGDISCVDWTEVGLSLLGGAVLSGLTKGNLVTKGLDVLRSARRVTKGIAGVPGRVQSRINLQTGTNKFGMKHILKEHLSGKTNKSQFSLTEGDLRDLLQSKQVVNSPIVKTLESKTHGTLYVRQVEVGRTIGTDYLKGNSATSMLTTQSDKFGNIVTAFPGL